jgi:hypothetical protein
MTATVGGSFCTFKVLALCFQLLCIHKASFFQDNSHAFKNSLSPSDVLLGSKVPVMTHQEKSQQSLGLSVSITFHLVHTLASHPHQSHLFGRLNFSQALV